MQRMIYAGMLLALAGCATMAKGAVTDLKETREENKVEYVLTLRKQGEGERLKALILSNGGKQTSESGEKIAQTVEEKGVAGLVEIDLIFDVEIEIKENRATMIFSNTRSGPKGTGVYNGKLDGHWDMYLYHVRKYILWCKASL